MCRLVIQRVLRGRVTVGQRLVGEVGRGLVVLIGIHRDDTRDDVAQTVLKMCRLRLFADGADNEEQGRWVSGVSDIKELGVLLVSQFTLNAAFKGRKPVFNASMKPELARAMFDYGVEVAHKELGEGRVQTGAFGERMEVELVNDGPVTIVLDSKKNGKGDEEAAADE